MVIVVVIPATTFLYVRSGHTTIKTPTHQPEIDATKYGSGVRKEFRTSDRTVIRNLQATRRSLNTGTIQDDYSVAKRVYANQKPTVVVRKNSINYEQFPANHRNDNDVGDRLYRYIDGYETFYVLSKSRVTCALIICKSNKYDTFRYSNSLNEHYNIM